MFATIAVNPSPQHDDEPQSLELAHAFQGVIDLLVVVPKALRRVNVGLCLVLLPQQTPVFTQGSLT